MSNPWLNQPDPYFGPQGYVKLPAEGIVLREAYEDPGEYIRLDDTGSVIGTYRNPELPCVQCGTLTRRVVVGAVRPLAHGLAVMKFGLVLTPCCEPCQRGPNAQA